MTADLFIQANNMLGEGPVWDHTQHELIWVDIEKKLLCFCNILTGDVSEIQMESRIGAVVPVNESSLYLMAMQSGLKLYNRDTGKLSLIADPEANVLNNRFNDGKCDKQGRFWFGSMDMQASRGKGNLYLLHENGKIELKQKKLTISNGLAFKDDLIYFVDSATQSVVRYKLEHDSGRIFNKKVVINIPKSSGIPDGICIDEEGMLWIALWGGGAVTRWDPMSGTQMQKIDVPVPQVSSCCFGGVDLDTLYITSARIGLTDNEIKKYPESGCVFSHKPGVNGLKTDFYKLRTP